MCKFCVYSPFKFCETNIEQILVYMNIVLDRLVDYTVGPPV